MHTTPRPPAPRLVFLDWVRIIAFFILILYHVGMYYVSWGWHVKSPFAGPAAEPFMLLSSPWRLGLLFLVSGVASGYMLSRSATGAFARRRSLRLLLPLVFGMLVVVPPQSYFEVVEQAGHTGGYGAFMGLYLSGYDGFCDADGCLIMPTWNHLWFVAYLWVYTLLLAGLHALFASRTEALAGLLGRLLTGWRIIVLPAAVLAAARLLLAPHFPQSHALFDDWYNHATYLPLFLFGALLSRLPGFWPRLGCLRWEALGIALACWSALVVWNALPDEALDPASVEGWRTVLRVAHALCAWSAMVAACGFAQRHLQQDGPARRYLTEAVFPVYIVHQTLIVVLAVLVRPARLAPGTEAVLLVVMTLVASFALFELVRRVRPLRPVFGLAPIRPAASPGSRSDALGVPG